MLSSQAIRQLFLEYFQDKQHKILSSSPLIPGTDSSLLFTNAGMVRFKSIFTGSQKILYPKVVSIQRCLRAGGKHNDLDNVGYTARHHTFFEMLGNFSFGNYFKKEAIIFAWEFLTKVLKLSKEKLWVTVFHEDDETANLWLTHIQIPKERLIRCDAKDNFWMMGETGPCGPCTEIFYDHGPNVSGGPPGSLEADGDRYVEIWNLVFMQYNRDQKGTLDPLPMPCVDTGMGLERLTAVMQNVSDNYDTDLFQPLIQAARKLFLPQQASQQTLKVIADHIRAISFLIFDGILPGNEGRAYVLRRIIRRALRHGYQANIRHPFLYQLINTFTTQMQPVYPSLEEMTAYIEDVVKREEVQFLKTLHTGMQYFSQFVAHFPQKVLPGNFVFKLYDTYGFPVDLTADLAKEQGLDWDQVEFEKEMYLQKQRSREHTTFRENPVLRTNLTQHFCGYTDLSIHTNVTALLNQKNQEVTQLNTQEKGSVLLENTPFYAESGGQVGDTGRIENQSHSQFFVTDTQKNYTVHLHQGYVTQGTIKIGDKVYATVDPLRRQAIAQNHSATHLLHAVLRNILGNAVFQKGSLVQENYLRFDFSYQGSVEQSIQVRIESTVNENIWKNLPIRTETTSITKAKAMGAMAIFSEKYDETVRVLKMGDLSTELCGGTHLKRTGEIGLFKITHFSSIAAGIKRIEAVTGKAALDWVLQLEGQQKRVAKLLNTSLENSVMLLESKLQQFKKQDKANATLQQALCHLYSQTLIKEATSIGGMSLLVTTIPAILADQVRTLIDHCRSQLPTPCLIVLGSINADKTQISISTAKHYTDFFDARKLADQLSSLLDATGGGRADFVHLTAKSTKEKDLKTALATVLPWVQAIQSHLHVST